MEYRKGLKKLVQCCFNRHTEMFTQLRFYWRSENKCYSTFRAKSCVQCATDEWDQIQFVCVFVCLCLCLCVQAHPPLLHISVFVQRGFPQSMSEWRTNLWTEPQLETSHQPAVADVSSDYWCLMYDSLFSVCVFFREETTLCCNSK